MSYILDALKKSERERQRENFTPLQHLCETPLSPPETGILRRRSWPWFVLCGCLLLGGLVTMLGWQRWMVTDPPAEMAAQQKSGGKTKPSAGEAVDRPAPDQSPHLDDLAGAQASPAAVVTTAAGKIDKPVRIARDRQKIVKALPQPDPAAAVEQHRPVLTVSGEPQTVSSGRPRVDLPYLQDLPAQMQADTPKLDFAGHAYALEPSQRLIVINGAIMREGDRIDDETRLAEITWEGVIIERKGTRFQVKCY